MRSCRFPVALALLIAGCSSEGSDPFASGTSVVTATSGDDGATGMATDDPATTTANPGDASHDDSTSAPVVDDTGESSAGGTSTGADDDADGDGSSTTGTNNNDDGPPEPCFAPGNLITCDDFDSNPTIFNALGLGCEGGVDEVIPIANESFTWTDPVSWSVLRQYGSYIDPNTNAPLWGPTEGDTMLLLSSGVSNAPDANGVVINNSLTIDTNNNPDNQQLPAPMSSQNGAAVPFVNCDGVNDCSNSISGQWAFGGGAANDLIWLSFQTDVPGGTHGFTLDFAYFSEEFPEYVNTQYNDMFIVWNNSETYTGNLCFIDDQPCTVTALCNGDATCPNLAFCGEPGFFFFGCANPTLNAPELAGTGFTNDGATGWFQIKGSAAPGETLQLSMAVFDMGDTIYDTIVLVDNFAWDCEGCTPTEVNPCGVIPQ